jgi:predicted Zn-dependent protease with MMP-like domain
VTPTTRRIVTAATIALAVGLAAVALWAPIPSGVAILAVAICVAVGTAALTAGLARWSEPTSEREFDAIVERAERLHAEGDPDLLDEPDEDDWETEDLFDPRNEEDFQALVRSALDDLPLQMHRALEHVAVVVSDGGRRRRAYGLYTGDGVARDDFPDRILIFRDTLVRDFGHDPVALKHEVTRTVRHELAHHLGWDERGVRDLGL